MLAVRVVAVPQNERRALNCISRILFPASHVRVSALDFRDPLLE